MDYCSTRDSEKSVTAAEAILQGISEEGGLIVPTKLPAISSQELLQFANLNYIQRAHRILSLFLTDFTDEELNSCILQAYSNSFEGNMPAPLTSLSDGRYLLELWHGPTAAFKDLALQLLPHLLTTSSKKIHSNSNIVILTATSGDTGKAALSGFAKIPGIELFVFYPEGGVSEIQRKQMVTQPGENVHVTAVNGNFDQAQTAVKQLFTDWKVRRTLKETGFVFSSANSINLGRLLPQIVYYFSAYSDLLAADEITLGEPIHVTVPTGNFGNILAAYYAKQMGLPIQRLICASNVNHILTDFIKTGVYDRNRPFYRSSSPSMDILVSSNLERFLYHLEEDPEEITDFYQKFAETGRFLLPQRLVNKMSDIFFAGYCNEEETSAAIQNLFQTTGYLCDPHTAVALSVEEQYRTQIGDKTKNIIVSTASPFKFPATVLSDLGMERPNNEFEAIKQLSTISGTIPPPSILALQHLPERFLDVIPISEMEQYLFQELKI